MSILVYVVNILFFSIQALGRTGVRSKYVDVLNPSAGKSVGEPTLQAPPPALAPPSVMPSNAPPSFFVPQQPLPSSSGQCQSLKAELFIDIVSLFTVCLSSTI